MGNETETLILYQNSNFQEPIRYTFQLMMSILGLNYKIVQIDESERHETCDSSLAISYGKTKMDLPIKNQIHIYESDFFGKNYLKPQSLPTIPLERYNTLPIIYRGTSRVENHVKGTKNLLETDIDFVASSFFMVSRYEEAIINVKDEYGRFPATASLAYREGFLDKPVVNQYIELLWSWIDSFNLGFERKRLWGNKDFAVCLTHDVDEVERYKFYPPLGAIKRALVQKDCKKAGAIWLDYLRTRAGLKRDPYHDAFDYIMDLEEQYGFTSSFYFMSNNERYSLNAPYSKELIMKLRNKGFEVGIHPASMLIMTWMC